MIDRVPNGTGSSILIAPLDGNPFRMALTHECEWQKSRRDYSRCHVPAGGTCCCRCPLPRTDSEVCSTSFRSDAVFLATVLSETRIASENDFIEGWRYRVRVKRSFRGATSGTVEVYKEKRTRLAVEQPRCFIERHRSLPEA